MLSITSKPKPSLPLSMVSIPAPTSLSNSSQTILTSSNQFEFSAWKSLPTPHPAFCFVLFLFCCFGRQAGLWGPLINYVAELLYPHPAFPTQHAGLTQQAHVGQQVLSENAVETNIYSVWAIPPKNVTENLKELMKNLRSEYGGPEFEPHFTVVGPNKQTETDAKNMFRAACQGLKPYTATMDFIVPGTSYYECVYCLLQPSEEVLETAAHCSKYFGDNILNQYILHVSLIFGDFTDEVKQKIIEKAETLYPEITRLSFQTSQLVLYRTDTDDRTLKTWEKVDEYNLI